MATLDTKTKNPFADIPTDIPFMEQMNRSDVILDELYKVANALPTPLHKNGKNLVALPDLPKTMVGRILRWQIADGYAFYRVTSAKPFKIQHLPVGDDWHIMPPTIRGLRLVDAANMVIRELSLNAIFSK